MTSDPIPLDAAQTEIAALLISLRQWIDHWERYRSDWPTSESLREARELVDSLADVLTQERSAAA